jgi:hypothetical protein
MEDRVMVRTGDGPVNKPIDPTDLWRSLAEKIEAEGPQSVAVEGHGPLTVMSEAQYRLLSERKPTFREWLLSGPKFDDLEIDHDRRPSRDFSF